MDNLNEALKEKSIHADKLEFFVFLPNDLNPIKSQNHTNKNKHFCDAVAAKDEGNVCFRKKQYDVAIEMYSSAIEKFENSETSCNCELAVCYQNRAAAQIYMKQYGNSILDASKAIELNDHYSKAYFRRAEAYHEQRKYFRALQDTVQASILERFRNKTYTDMIGVLLTQIEQHPSELQWRMAYTEMEADELHCEHCIMSQIKFVKNCGILGLICVPIPKDQPHIGYIKAMVGLNQFDMGKIMAGCEEEEAMNGKYLAQSFIVRAYMNTVVVKSVSKFCREYPKDLRRMNVLISDEHTPADIKFNARLCRANMYNRRGNFKDASIELKSLEEKCKNNPLVYIVKSGALMQLSQRLPEFSEALHRCCTLLPNVYELQLQQVMVEVATLKNPLLRITAQSTKFNQLINRFPNEIEPRIYLAGLYAKINETRRAKAILKKSERDLPNHKNELNSVYGMLNPTHSSCVAYFKRSLSLKKDDPNALAGLLEYFHSTTFEYAKAIEVATKALYTYQEAAHFQKIFECRQALLKRIVQQDFWDRL